MSKLSQELTTLVDQLKLSVDQQLMDQLVKNVEQNPLEAKELVRYLGNKLDSFSAQLKRTLYEASVSESVLVDMIDKEINTIILNKWIEQKRDFTLKNNLGNTMLPRLCQHKDYEYEIKKILDISDIELVNIQNKQGDTPLHIACTNRCDDIIKLLVEKGADTKIKNIYNQSPVDIAKNWAMVYYLSKH